MARKLDPQQLAEFKAFLDDLRNLGGFETDAEWSRQSGVHSVNLSNARTGKSQLDGYNLLRLIRSVAERAGSDAAAAASRAARNGRDDRLEELRAAVAALTDHVTTGFQTVGTRLDGLDQRLSAQEQQAPRRGRGRAAT